MMNGARFEFDGTIEEKKGQQFVNGRGRYGQGFTRLHRPEPHGFASQPISGAKGLLVFPNGQSDEGYVLGGEHPEKRPTGLPSGATALYDANGNIIRLLMSEVVMDFASRTITMIGGEWQITGNVTITGNLEVNGNIHASGTIIDELGNTNHHVH
ncbi:phage baseplate assembly protein [Sinorhizobium sp. BG8]|uniref:phage baseplate assembly protein domain-containing protein n=1 Tax=Sinorhizobium sp. BG8 TaxID=2613773 RepID=UPI00193DC5E4|nr:phage baseplate assembly protein [Sinorhizobium sp. BG8]